MPYRIRFLDNVSVVISSGGINKRSFVLSALTCPRDEVQGWKVNASTSEILCSLVCSLQYSDAQCKTFHCQLLAWHSRVVLFKQQQSNKC